MVFPFCGFCVRVDCYGQTAILIVRTSNLGLIRQIDRFTKIVQRWEDV